MVVILLSRIQLRSNLFKQFTVSVFKSVRPFPILNLPEKTFDLTGMFIKYKTFNDIFARFASQLIICTNYDELLYVQEVFSNFTKLIAL